MKIGERFGMLIVERFVWRSKSIDHFQCLCECGERVIVQAYNLKNGNTKSCGCLRNHGFSKTPEYRAWLSMKQRCCNLKNADYKDYGGRGITVCDSWKKSFLNFLEDMGPRPEGLTLERKNNDGNYEPHNCKWTTPKQQARNSRRNRILEFNGKKRCLTAWAEELGYKWQTVTTRLNRGWSIERALTEPIKRKR